MAKRFTDSEKWNDVWFTELNNDQRIIWIYLLDNCDNAGIFKLNMKLINFNCSTNISVEEFIFIYKERITQINKESWLINKFCSYQYGTDFLIKTGNKAVQSAIKKLMEVKVVELIDNNYTLSIPYSSTINTLSIEDKYPIDTLKDKDRDKDVDKNIFKDEEQDMVKSINKDKVEKQEQDRTPIIKKLLRYNKQLIEEGLVTTEQIETLSLTDARYILNDMFYDVVPDWEDKLNTKGYDGFLIYLRSKNVELDYILDAAIKTYQLL